MMDEMRDEKKNDWFWWIFPIIMLLFAFMPPWDKSKDKEVKDMTEQEKRDVENILHEVEKPIDGDANWAIKMLMNGMLGDAPIRPMTESEQIHYLMGKVEAYEKMMMGGK